MVDCCLIILKSSNSKRYLVLSLCLQIQVTSQVSACTKQIQASKRNEYVAKLSRPLINKAVMESREQAVLQFIDDHYVPKIRDAVDRLFFEASLVQSSVIELSPFAKQYVNSLGSNSGIINYCKAEMSLESCLPETSLHEECLHTMHQVIKAYFDENSSLMSIKFV